MQSEKPATPLGRCDATGTTLGKLDGHGQLLSVPYRLIVACQQYAVELCYRVATSSPSSSIVLLIALNSEIGRAHV